MSPCVTDDGRRATSSICVSCERADFPGSAGYISPWVLYTYLASALWALSLVIGVVLSVQSAYTLPVYFPDEKTLFPVWPVIDPTKALYLFLGTVALVLLPKVLGVASALIRRDPAAHYTGRFLLGAAVETLFSILIAPILMLTQTSAVLEILRGKDSGWTVQRREGEPPPLSEVIRFHKWHVVTGAALAVICGLVSLYVFSWMAPIFLANCSPSVSQSSPQGWRQPGSIERSPPPRTLIHRQSSWL